MKNKLLQTRLNIEKSIKDAMEMTENDECISCKEMALTCLYAICEPQYRPDHYKDAIKLIISGGNNV